METRTEIITKEELSAINRYTRRELTADDVYTFSVVLCDNEIDRDLERFDSAALPILAEMFVGKTGIFDHVPSAQNQRARIYAAECVTDAARKTQAGEEYCCVKAKAYIPRTESNAALIEEIESGIKKEVSVGCAMTKVVCSICGEELRRGTCSHKRGRSYRGQICHAVLCGPSDAYEWSFVAVPAQLAAGVAKQAGAIAENETGTKPEHLGMTRKTAESKPCKPAVFCEAADADDCNLNEAVQIRAAVREETLRVALSALPALDEETANALCSQLSFRQCRDFSFALREKQTLARAKTPQLFLQRADAQETNSDFKI